MFFFCGSKHWSHVILSRLLGFTSMIKNVYLYLFTWLCIFVYLMLQWPWLLPSQNTPTTYLHFWHQMPICEDNTSVFGEILYHKGFLYTITKTTTFRWSIRRAVNWITEAIYISPGALICTVISSNSVGVAKSEYALRWYWVCVAHPHRRNHKAVRPM